LEARERSFTEKTPMKISKERCDRRHRIYKYIYLIKASFYRAKKSFDPGLIPKNWTVEKCSSAQVKGAEGNEEKSVQ
jgi:hypothetical protein